MTYPPEEIENRKTLLYVLMKEVRREVFEIVQEQGERDDLMQRVNEEMHMDAVCVDEAVRYYYEVLLVQYKAVNKFHKDELANRDKIAALMALAILTLRPLRSLTGTVGLIETRLANEILALKFAYSTLEIAIDRPDVPGPVIQYLLANLQKLGELARERFLAQREIQPHEPIVGWLIQSMQLFGVAFGRIGLDVEEAP